MSLGNLFVQGSFDSTSENTLNGNFKFMQATGFPNYIASETGANNGIAAALLDPNGVPVPLAAGLRVMILLAHTLQAGANTLALNGGTAKNITSHRNTASNIGTGYSVGGIVDLVYDGTEWQDLSQ